MLNIPGLAIFLSFSYIVSGPGSLQGRKAYMQGSLTPPLLLERQAVFFVIHREAPNHEPS